MKANLKFYRLPLEDKKRKKIVHEQPGIFSAVLNRSTLKACTLIVNIKILQKAGRTNLNFSAQLFGNI